MANRIDIINKALVPNEFFAKVNEIITNVNAIDVSVTNLSNICASMQNSITRVQESIDTLNTWKTNITGLVPSAASTANQLADKTFVIDSVQSLGGVYCGQWSTYVAVPTTLEEFTEAGEAIPAFNAYLYVNSDETHGNARYKYRYNSIIDEEHDYNKENWRAEFPIYTSPFSTQEIAALHSNITEAKVSDYDAHIADDTIHVTDVEKISWNDHLEASDIHVTEEDKETWTAKQDPLTPGLNITINSENVISCSYTLPEATNDTLGGVIVGSTLDVENGILNAPFATPSRAGISKVGENLVIDSANKVLSVKASPDFKGIPTAPTASANTSSTQIATTEFVKTAIDNPFNKDVWDWEWLIGNEFYMVCGPVNYVEDENGVRNITGRRSVETRGLPTGWINLSNKVTMLPKSLENFDKIMIIMADEITGDAIDDSTQITYHLYDVKEFFYWYDIHNKRCKFYSGVKRLSADNPVYTQEFNGYKIKYQFESTKNASRNFMDIMYMPSDAILVNNNSTLQHNAIGWYLNENYKTSLNMYYSNNAAVVALIGLKHK